MHEFDEVVVMLADGFTTRRGRRGALIHRDAVNGILRSRRGARLTALTSGGTIPDLADYQVLLEPQSLVVGTINEDFAIESAAGDVFQLGNTSYRILRVERGVVRVEDAQGAPPTIPFWLGEAPGRSNELSAAVSRLRGEMASRLADDPAGGTARLWLARELGMAEAAALQLVEYLAAAQGALGGLPTQKTIVLERFFDEAGGMQLVVHSPFGSRINRAWGLALRKRFCRKFNFELQAAATEDCIVLSLTTAHSFELTEVAALSPLRQRARGADPGDAGCADVHHPLALGGGRVAGAAALPRRQEGAAAARPHGRRGPDRQRLPRPDRVCGEPHRRARGARPPAGRSGDHRLPHRGHGPARIAAPAEGAGGGHHPCGGARPQSAVAAGARGAERAALRVPRRRSRWRSGAPRP